MKPSALKAALAAAGVCALTNVAYGAAPGTAGSAAQPSGDTDLTEVTITGSRVILNGNDAPTPVTVLTPEQVLATKPTTLYENLVDLPAFSGSRGPSNGSIGNAPTGGGNVSTLNLRNQGSTRTLVLFDGKRVPPATPDGFVDVNGLPQMLIQRVDVVTGGASAVYGSDAITGVVNFITDSKFVGTKFNLQRGISVYNDDSSYEVGAAWGSDLFGGRGHLEASYQRHNDSGLIADSRSWAAPRWTVQGNGTTIPYHLQDNVVNATASYGGVITCPTGTSGSGTPNKAGCPGTAANLTLVGQSFNQNGVLSPYNAGLQGASAGLAGTAVQIGGDGVYFNNVAIKSSTRLDQLFARFDYDLTDALHGYIAASGTENYVVGPSGVQRTFTPGWRIGVCNAYLPSQYQSQLGCTPTLLANQVTDPNMPFFWFNKAFDPYMNYGAGQNNRAYSHNYFVMASLDGKFGAGYRWEGTYTHSQANLNVRALNQNYKDIYSAIDAVVNPANGQIVCRVTLTNPTQYPGCVPFNLFGPTSMTQDMINYMFKEIQNTTRNKLDGFSGSITGAPFNSWAGPVNIALSGELRKLTMDLDTTSRPSNTLDCVGLRFGGAPTPVQGACSPGVTTPQVNGWEPLSGVNQTITEGALEINLPVLKDRSLFRDVSLNGAGRYTRYKNDPNNAGNGTSVIATSFNATTWKAGLVWEMPGGVTVRAARSRDIRAPALYDLYLPATIGNATFTTDYLLGNGGGTQVAAAPKQGGNPYLVPEVGHTTTMGIVYRPSPRFSLALDAYRITLVNALFSLNGGSQVVQQTCYASGGSSPLCQLQERPFGCCSNTTLQNALTAVYTRNINIAQQKVSGIDLEGNWNTQLLDRALSLRGLLTYQPHINYTLPNDPVKYDNAGVAYSTVGGGQPSPIWKGSLFAHYKLSERWSVDVSERYRSRLHWVANPALSQIGGAGSAAYTNLSVAYDVPTGLSQLNVFLNVQNLFNKPPAPAGQLANTFPGSFPNGFVVGDDLVGSYYVLGVRVRL